ncbi:MULTISPECIES: hypothetical protein [Gordonia]|uniref:Uncharacterized protein n=2 Tax=Gordonia TaxID=2053 RepID=L7LF93_9ACTN|nr:MULTISPECIES: hypothetical protein [Gordonia]AUH69868.1 hypothetical protein CXX93_18120 [Gordonia sp. YC-JH1]KJR06509.1 hypothetical protein UG54_13550 [Gordonia sihwensis]KXT56546.1 hypothetical protein Y710_13790 [Gordonia sp. QH-12]MBY4571621.1 hypothetical protein [Gordonia sihwensis]WFN93529.1 hypothetical protein P5P27_02875 [Gordonia sihwensis]
MHDPNYVFPDSAIPEWVRRYSRSAARRHDTFVRTTGTWLPGLRNRRGRRLLSSVLLILLCVVVISSIASFWAPLWSAVPFAIGLVTSLVVLMMLRVVTESIAGAPADTLDELQLTQRNAARALSYNLLLPPMMVVYAILIVLGYRDYVSGETVMSIAWLLIASVYALSCVPDVLMSWWMQDPEPEHSSDEI